MMGEGHAKIGNSPPGQQNGQSKDGGVGKILVCSRNTGKMGEQRWTRSEAGTWSQRTTGAIGGSVVLVPIVKRSPGGLNVGAGCDPTLFLEQSL